MTNTTRYPLYADWPDAMKQPPDPELAALAKRWAAMEAIAAAAEEVFDAAFTCGIPLPPRLAVALQAMHEKSTVYRWMIADAASHGA